MTGGDAVSAVSAVTVGLQISWLSAAGKLVDDAAAADLADALAGQRAVGCRFVWLDLSRVSVLDRVSFEVLVEAHHRFLAAGGALVLTGVSPRIARLLELAGQGETIFATVTQSVPHPDQPERELQQAVSDGDDAQAMGPVDGLSAAKGRSLDEQATIDRAIGVVMWRTRCGVQEALEQLVLLGQATNRTLCEVAQSILDVPSRIPTRPAEHPRGEPVGPTLPRRAADGDDR